jgi:hypothetical protein
MLQLRCFDGKRREWPHLLWAIKKNQFKQEATMMLGLMMCNLSGCPTVNTRQFDDYHTELQ